MSRARGVFSGFFTLPATARPGPVRADYLPAMKKTQLLAVVLVVLGVVLGVVAPAQAAINRSAAVSWAVKNYQAKERFPGNDCTWFVSQALWAGGVTKSSSWNGPEDVAAINAQAFTTYVRDKGLATVKEVRWSDNTAGRAALGDVIAYDWFNKKTGTTRADGIIDHLAIVTRLDARGYPSVTQHSLARLNRYWSWDPGANNWIERSRPGSKVYLVKMR